MKTITFYSYKGGVGRSMALANVAWRLAQKGKVVGVVDLDVEAPGLTLIEEFSGQATVPGGLYAYLQAVDPDTRWGQRDQAVRLGDYCRLLQPQSFKPPGKVYFLPSEALGDASLADFSRKVARYLEKEGDKPTDPTPLLALKKGFEDLGCEYLFVDSRTGLCAVAGVATILYPEQVVMVLGLNRQNLRGIEMALREFGEPVQQITWLLPSLVPIGEEDRKEAAFTQVKEILGRFKLPADRLLGDVSLPYHPQLAVDDRPMLVEGFANLLVERYGALTNRLVGMNPDDPLTLLARAESLLDSKEPAQAIALIGRLYGRPPFGDDVRFLKAYGRACTESGFTVAAEAPLLLAIYLVARAEEAAGRPPLPTIKTALLNYERMVKAERDRDVRIAFLRGALDYRGTDDDRGALYSAVANAYAEDPPDAEGIVRWNREVVSLKPEFAPSATAIIARMYAVQGNIERAHAAFAQTVAEVRRISPPGRATDQALSNVYWEWARLCTSLRDHTAAMEKLRESLRLSSDHDKPIVELKLAQAQAQGAEDPIQSEIHYLEGVRSTKPMSGQGREKPEHARIVKRLASLYEKSGQYEESAKRNALLLELEPWDRHNIVSRIARLCQVAGTVPDPAYEAALESQLAEQPHDLMTARALSHMKLRRGDVAGSVEVALRCAEHEPALAGLVATGMGNDAVADWGNEDLVDAVLRALQSPVFSRVRSARTYAGGLLGSRGQWEAALEASRGALALANDEERPDTARFVSQHLERLGKWPELLEFCDRVLREHPDDVNWPPDACSVLIRVSEHFQGDERRLYLERALELLERFERRTGRQHLPAILPLRYDILVARLNREQSAWDDLKRISTASRLPTEPRHPRAVAQSEADIHRFAGHLRDALGVFEQFAKFAADEDDWKRGSTGQADLRFALGDPSAALRLLDDLGISPEDESESLSLRRLRCLEALGEQQEVEGVLERLSRGLPKGKLLKLPSGDDLAFMVRCYLRRRDGVEQAAFAARSIGFVDVARRDADAQAAAALYHLCCGDAQEAERLLGRLHQLGQFYEWLPEFLHDLKVIAGLHRPDLDLPAIRSRFPSFS